MMLISVLLVMISWRAGVARLEPVSGTVFWNSMDFSRSSVEVVLPLEGLRTGDDALNKLLRDTVLFNATDYPTITFKTSAMIPQIATNEVTVVGVTDGGPRREPVP